LKSIPGSNWYSLEALKKLLVSELEKSLQTVEQRNKNWAEKKNENENGENKGEQNDGEHAKNDESLDH